LLTRSTRATGVPRDGLRQWARSCGASARHSGARTIS